MHTKAKAFVAEMSLAKTVYIVSSEHASNKNISENAVLQFRKTRLSADLDIVQGDLQVRELGLLSHIGYPLYWERYPGMTGKRIDLNYSYSLAVLSRKFPTH